MMAFDEGNNNCHDWDGSGPDPHSDMENHIQGLIVGCILSCEINQKCVECTMRRLATVILAKWIAFESRKVHGVELPVMDYAVHHHAGETAKTLMNDVMREYTKQAQFLRDLARDEEKNKNDSK